MPSSNKTAHLALNHWSGADKPKMADFNNDNQNIDTGVKALDTALSAHLASTLVHLSTQNKEKLSQVLTINTHTYTGDGAGLRKITLGYKPRFGIVFAVGRPMFEISAYDCSLKQLASVFTEIGSPESVVIESDGITVDQYNFCRPDGNAPRLNEKNATYVIVTAR